MNLREPSAMTEVVLTFPALVGPARHSAIRHWIARKRFEGHVIDDRDHENLISYTDAVIEIATKILMGAPPPTYTQRYLFEDKSIAALFKLTFGGNA